jgi:hypothetical protein
MTKSVPTAALATLSTGTVLTGMTEILDAAAAVLGFPVMHHQLGGQMGEIQARIHALFPDLPRETFPEGPQATLAAALARYGESVDVPRGDATPPADPLEGLDPDRTIVALTP